MLAHYRPKIQKVIEFFEFQSSTQHPFYVAFYDVNRVMARAGTARGTSGIITFGKKEPEATLSISKAEEWHVSPNTCVLEIQRPKYSKYPLSKISMFNFLYKDAISRNSLKCFLKAKSIDKELFDIQHFYF